MPLATSSETEAALSMGLLWTVGDTTSSIGSGSSVLYGIQTGNKQVIYMNRAYSSASTLVVVDLFENAWIGGTPLVTRNRNLSITGQTSPASHVQGPTGTPSGTPVATITLQGGGLLAGGLGVSPESEWYMLKANTQYLLRISQLQALVSATVTFRYTLKAAN